PQAHQEGRVIKWMELLPFPEGEYPHVRQRLAPIPCQHCDRPPCTPVCPVFATYKNPEGLVAQIYPRCIGCRYCVNACPYTCKFFNWDKPVWPQEVEMPFNPDVSVRYKGVVEKCLFCHHRYQRAKDKAREEGREVRQGDYTPACVAACPAQAIVFGDLSDPKSEVSKAAATHRSYRILEELGTKPKVIYLREG
ncbi:MAG: 4Fe-4S dicluster domain-containing protein, partial [Elusimicrobia bacterium]|nr:4Fe-4S dicluster domain-containing protein [Elusimicrobiota bacterium]